MSKAKSDPPEMSNIFPFMKLPKEIRVMVYERLPRRITRVDIRQKGDKASQLHLYLRGTDVAILRASKLIYQEARQFVGRVTHDFILCRSPQMGYRVGKSTVALTIGDLIMAEIDKSLDILKRGLQKRVDVSAYDAYLAALKTSSTIQTWWDRMPYWLPREMANSMGRRTEDFDGAVISSAPRHMNIIQRHERFICAFIIQSSHQLLYHHIMHERGTPLCIPPLPIQVVFYMYKPQELEYELASNSTNLTSQALLALQPLSRQWRKQRRFGDPIRYLVGVKPKTSLIHPKTLEPPESLWNGFVLLHTGYPVLSHYWVHYGMSQDEWKENWIPSHVLDVTTQRMRMVRITDLWGLMTTEVLRT